jgi:integrase
LGSVGVVVQTMGVPLLVTPVAPAVEQKAPGVTAGPGAGAGGGGGGAGAGAGVGFGVIWATTPPGSGSFGQALRTVARLPRVHKRYLSHEQVARLAEECRDEDVVLLTLAYTGIRWGELAAIRVGRVAPGVRRIHIAEAMSEVNGKVMFGPPKTHADRWVAVPRFLQDRIGALMAGKGPNDLLFTSPRGEVLRVHGFRRRAFDRAAASLGLTGLVPHELRHTAASLAVASGAKVKAVQSMLGHASAAMTLDRYSHLFDDSLEAVADRLDQARERSVVPPVCPQASVAPLLGEVASA